jgi:SAM-dependent methyltransferase
LGAIVTGADFSERDVEAARALAAELSIPATFIRSELYALPDVLDERFDIVYTSRGVLGWLPDMRRWAQVAARFVRPGGFLYVTEIHPIAQVFETDDVAPGELRLTYPYWSHPDRPLRFDDASSYADPSIPLPGLTEYGWDHSLGEIVTALIDAGLRIDFLHEFDFLEWPADYLVESPDGRWRLPPDKPGQLPLMFSIRASKPPG